MIPYLRNHHSKGPSYPERYFADIFSQHGLTFVQEYRFKRFSLDFAILDKKIDIEIDGELHFKDEKSQERDKIRDDILKSELWKVIRIRWKTYKKLSNENQQIFVQNLLNQISGP